MNFLDPSSIFVDEEKLIARLHARMDNTYTQDEIESVVNYDSRIFKKELNLTQKDVDLLKHLINISQVKISVPKSIVSHRKYLGPVIVFFKKIVYRLVGYCISPTLKIQSDFNTTLIAYLIQREESRNISVNNDYEVCL